MLGLYDLLEKGKESKGEFGKDDEFLIRYLIRSFWFLYFVYLVRLFVLSLDGISSAAVDWVDIFMMVPSMIVILCLAAEKIFLQRVYWKIYFCCLLIWDFYFHFFLNNGIEGLSLMDGISLGISLFPLYWGVGIYAFLFRERDS